MLFVKFKNRGGISIENKVLKLKQLVNCEDKKIMQDIIGNILSLEIKEIKYDKNMQLSNISE